MTYLLPNFDEIQSKLINNKIFIVLIVKNGFGIVNLIKSLESLVLLIPTSFGYFKSNRRLFGIATGYFQKHFGDIRY